MFGSIGVPELILILVILVLVFGVGRISKIAGEMGSGIRSFRKGLSQDDEEKKDAETKDAEKKKEG
jgi:sec-independent protein translocase protein TatA